MKLRNKYKMTLEVGFLSVCLLDSQITMQKILTVWILRYRQVHIGGDSVWLSRI